MTIPEFETLFAAKHIPPASLIFQGNPHERLSSLESYVNGGELPSYDYTRLHKYCLNDDGLQADYTHLNTCREKLAHITPINDTEKEIVSLYKQKIQFRTQERELLQNALEDLQKSSGESVYKFSRELYGDVNENIYTEYLDNLENLSEFDALLNNYYDAMHREFDVYFSVAEDYSRLSEIDANAAVSMANEILEAVSITQWKAKKSTESSSVRIMQSLKELWIPATFNRNLQETIKLMIHEIGVHITRRENGAHHAYRIFSDGTVLDNRIEEGVSIFIESIVDARSHTLPSAVFRATYRYLAVVFALGLDGTVRNSVKAVFNDLVAHNKAHGNHLSTQQLVEVIDNIYRGTNFKNPRNVYVRAKIYLEGFLDVSSYLKTRTPSLAVMDDMLTARYDFTNQREVDILQTV